MSALCTWLSVSRHPVARLGSDKNAPSFQGKKEVTLGSGASHVDLNWVNLLCSKMKAIVTRSMCSAAA